jgi:hypothetical protein
MHQDEIHGKYQARPAGKRFDWAADSRQGNGRRIQRPLFEEAVSFGSFSLDLEGVLMRILVLLSSILILLCISFTAHAQTGSQQRLEGHIRFLADDLLKGRGTPSHDLDVSALYLANQLRADGWQPANGDSYHQTYTLKSFSAQQARYHLSLNGFKLDSKDVIFLPFGMDPADTPAKYDLVFAGHGVFAPERDVDDFDGVDLRGKAVVAMLGAPWKIDPKAVHAYDRAVGKSVHVTVRNGSFLIYVSEEFEAPADAESSAEVRLFREMSKVPFAFLPEFQGRPTIGLGPILVITPAIFDKTLAKTTGGTYT